LSLALGVAWRARSIGASGIGLRRVVAEIQVLEPAVDVPLHLVRRGLEPVANDDAGAVDAEGDGVEGRRNEAVARQPTPRARGGPDGILATRGGRKDIEHECGRVALVARPEDDHVVVEIECRAPAPLRVPLEKRVEGGSVFARRGLADRRVVPLVEVVRRERVLVVGNKLRAGSRERGPLERRVGARDRGDLPR